jgi:transcriptional regulator with XRE-family HTH domain
MGTTEFAESRFRENLRRERETRKWSQAHLAKLLSSKGLAVYSTTVAKIESGERAARIDEVVGIADLFNTSVDALLGHSSRRRRGGDKGIPFSALTEALKQAVGQTELSDATLRNRLSGLDGLDLRRDEVAARDECERAADALADAVAAIRKAQRRLSPIQSRMVSEFLTDDSHNNEEFGE